LWRMGTTFFKCFLFYKWGRHKRTITQHLCAVHTICADAGVPTRSVNGPLSHCYTVTDTTDPFMRASSGSQTLSGRRTTSERLSKSSTFHCSRSSRQSCHITHSNCTIEQSHTSHFAPASRIQHAPNLGPGKTRRHPRNRKYNVVRGGPSYCHRQRSQKAR